MVSVTLTCLEELSLFQLATVTRKSFCCSLHAFPYLNLYQLNFYKFMLSFRKINEATKKQLDKVWHTTNIYLHPKIHEYAERLVAKLPGDLKVHSLSITN